MRGLFNRAVIVAAVVVASTAIALPPAACASSASGNGSTVTAPNARLADSFSLDLPVVSPPVSTGPTDLSRFATNEVESEILLFDGVSLDSGFNVDVARMLDRYAPTAGAYDGLFYSTIGSPYAALSSGGSYVGANWALGDSLHVAFGQASTAPGLNRYLLDPSHAVTRLGGLGVPYDERSTNSLLTGVSWNFARWGGLDLTASQTMERGGALGMSDTAINTARTSALGFSAHVGLGGGWVTEASYSEGITQLNLKPGTLPAGTESGTHSQSYGIAVAKRGLFGNDALGVAFVQPPLGYFGSNNTFSATPSNEMQFFARNQVFSGKTPETDIELGYITAFRDGQVALQANAAYQTNVGGQNGLNAVSLLSRAKIKF